MHFLVILCFVPVILNRPGSLWDAHTRQHKKSTTLSKWNSFSSSLSSCLVSQQAALIWCCSLIRPSTYLVTWFWTCSTGDQIHQGSLNWYMCISRNTKELSKGWVCRGGFKGISFQILNFYIYSFLKLILPERKLTEKEQAFFSHFLLHFSLLTKMVCFSLFPILPKCMTPGHKDLKGAKQRDTWNYLCLSITRSLILFFQPHWRRP